MRDALHQGSHGLYILLARRPSLVILRAPTITRKILILKSRLSVSDKNGTGYTNRFDAWKVYSSGTFSLHGNKSKLFTQSVESDVCWRVRPYKVRTSVNIKVQTQLQRISWRMTCDVFMHNQIHYNIFHPSKNRWISKRVYY